MRTRIALAIAPFALALACGGGTTSSTSDLSTAAPSYAALALDQVSTDGSPSAQLVAEAPTAFTGPAVTGGSGTGMGGAGCHPHLFLREREVVERVNRHLYKVLRHVEAALARDPLATAAGSQVWSRVDGGLERKFTITPRGNNVYDWMLEIGPAGQTLTKVLWGDIDRTGASGPHLGHGSLHADFGALHSVVPQEPVSAGTLDVKFDSQAASRMVAVTATGIAWELDAAMFDVPALQALTRARSGAYVYYREPGVGGSLKIKDQMIFFCPANPGLVAADAELASQWLKQADGSIHGRSDARMTNGQLATGDQVVGVTCHNGVAEGRDQREGFWLMKYEPAGSSGPFAGESSSHLADPTATACDPAFGPVPTLADRDGDFQGWPTSYSEGIFSYPGVPFP
jgi:hypothetical protein